MYYLIDFVIYTDMLYSIFYILTEISRLVLGSQLKILYIKNIMSQHRINPDYTTVHHTSPHHTTIHHTTNNHNTPQHTTIHN